MTPSIAGSKYRREIKFNYALTQFFDVNQQSLAVFRRREIDTILTRMLSVELADVKLPRTTW